MGGGATASFVYDADGWLVKATVNGMTTVYIGDYYEQTGSTVKKYYYAAGSGWPCARMAPCTGC